MSASSAMFGPASRVLLIRLRSIGDTVLLTPVLDALTTWSPDIRLSVLSEPLSAPILESHPLVDELIVVPRTRNFMRDALARSTLVARLRRMRFDAAINFHGGTTGAWLGFLAGAPRRIGYALRNTKFLLTDVAPEPREIWGKETIHCVEQQLGLVKFAGIPLPARPRLSLGVAAAARTAVSDRLAREGIGTPYAVVHPAAAFASKEWEATRFARMIDFLTATGLAVVVMVAPNEGAVAERVRAALATPRNVAFISDFSLSEAMALIADCAVFVGNDSGPAHIAAAFGRRQVVIFGSSNEKVWGPWNDAPHRIVRHQLPCVPCAGYACHAFPEPECIKRVTVDDVQAAVAEVIGDRR